MPRPSRQRYTVFFDPGRIKRGLELNEELGRPVREGASYSLIIDHAWPDAEGNPLAGIFAKKLSVGPPDLEPIDVTSWEQGRVPTTGTRDRLVLSFPEPLDHGVLGSALSVSTSANDRIDGEMEIGSDEMQWAFVPRRPWTAGEYAIVALPILEDLAGNRIHPRSDSRSADRDASPFCCG